MFSSHRDSSAPPARNSKTGPEPYLAPDKTTWPQHKGQEAIRWLITISRYQTSIFQISSCQGRDPKISICFHSQPSDLTREQWKEHKHYYRLQERRIAKWGKDIWRIGKWWIPKITEAVTYRHLCKRLETLAVQHLGEPQLLPPGWMFHQRLPFPKRPLWGR